MTEQIETPRRYRRRGSFFWPLLLIAVGVVFLLDNLGMTGGTFWESLVRLWPLLLIVGGLDGLWRGEGLAGAALVIAAGVVFLLSNLGYLAVNFWEVVLNLWPLFLIAAGIDIIIGRRSRLGQVVGMLAILVIFLGALWSFGARPFSGQAVSGQQFSQALESAGAARVEIQPGAGNLLLDGAAASGMLLEGSLPEERGMQVVNDFSLNGETANLTLRQDGMDLIFPGRGEQWNWNLHLTPVVPVDLRVSLGAGKADLKLGQVTLEGLEANIGAGEMTVTLPANGEYRVKLNGAVGQITVILPPGLEARIQANTALGQVQAPAGYRRDGKQYTSPGYDTATQRVNLEISQAIGQVVVKQP